MALFTNSELVDSLLLIATLLGLLYYYLTATYDYWKKRGVPYIEPVIFFGNLKDQFLLKENFIFAVNNVYKRLAGERFGGYFESRKPVLMIRDPELVQRILIKDFSHFTNRDFVQDVVSDPLAGNLFNLKGLIWKNLRNKLTPTFTTGKLRGMIDQFCNCGEELLNEMEKSTLKNEAVDAKMLGSLYAIDVTASVTFGLQFKPNSPEGILFRKMTNMIFLPTRIRMLQFFIILYFPKVAKMFKLKQFPKEIEEYITNLVKTTIEYREKNNIQRNDFLQLMMNLKAQESSGKEMNWKTELSEEDTYLNQMDYASNEEKWEPGTKVVTDECIAANSLVFLTGGAEAVANSISFTLYELAINQKIQKRLQQEVDSVLNKYGGKLTYEGLKEMTYLDLVVQEKNRKYSEGGFLMRVCDIPYTIPGTDVVVEKGTRVVIPLFAIHNDPANYPDPDAFIPERFEGNNHRITGTYLPFGDGPRVCIAMRFVILELKACIAKVMSQYTVTLDSKTPIPLQYDPKAFNLVPKGGIWIRCQKRMLEA